MMVSCGAGEWQWFARTWDVGTWVTLGIAALVIGAWLVMDLLRWWQRRRRIRHMTASGAVLDRLVRDRFGFERKPGETDNQLRARCIAIWRTPRGGYFDGTA